MTWDGGSPELPPLWGPGMVRDLGPARASEDPLERRHENIAASLQRRLEEVVLAMLRDLHERTKLDALCLAGGVALNCVVNGKIFDETPFRRVYIQPAAYDGGTSVGAAYFVHHQRLGNPRGFVMDHAYWGPEFDDARMRRALDSAGVGYERVESARAGRTHGRRPRRRRRSSAGTRAGWSSGLGPSGTAPSWWTPDVPI